MDGSLNFQAAIAAGAVVGDAKYADMVPHHERSADGAWNYVRTHNQRREALLLAIIDGDGEVSPDENGELSATAYIVESFPARTKNPERDYERAEKRSEIQAYLMQDTGGGYVAHELAFGDNLVFASDGSWDRCERDGDQWRAEYFAATLIRQSGKA